MIPEVDADSLEEIEITTQPGRTYKMQLDAGTVVGMTDEIEAVKQAVFKILSTERYKYAMYDWDYGIELEDLFGKPISYVCPELERRIKDALSIDDRINSVDSFDFKVVKKHVLRVTFMVHTIYGDAQVEKEVTA